MSKVVNALKYISFSLQNNLLQQASIYSQQASHQINASLLSKAEKESNYPFPPLKTVHNAHSKRRHILPSGVWLSG